MAFFDNFKLLKKKKNYSVQYKEKTLALVNAEVIGTVIKDYATKKFLKEIANIAKDTMAIREDDIELQTKAMSLEKFYTGERRKHRRNKNIKGVGVQTKEFKSFVVAIKIINRHNTNYKIFLKAQLEGLKFVNNGKGTFPKPAQLSTVAAEERLIDYLHEHSMQNDVENFDRLELNYTDKNTGLMENPRFASRHKKLKDGTASLQDAYFMHDCMKFKRGEVHSMITDYIEKLEGSENE